MEKLYIMLATCLALFLIVSTSGHLQRSPYHCCSRGICKLAPIMRGSMVGQGLALQSASSWYELQFHALMQLKDTILYNGGRFIFFNVNNYAYIFLSENSYAYMELR